MTTNVRLKQGSPEWHEHRSKYRNASETAAVLGVSPWQTPYDLWCIRTGRTETKLTPAMAHGAATEGAAREAYEHAAEIVVEPVVLVDGDYSASLDGITLEGDFILEIKCPYKGRDSELWRSAAKGEIPEYYAWQIEHQFMVSGAKLAHLWVFDGKDGILVERRPDPSSWDRIRTAWDAFCQHLATDTPPPLTDRDCRVREDQLWCEAAQRYLEAKVQAEACITALDAAKAALLGMASHPSESGAGVKVTRYWKTGTVDYKKIPELKGIDLEPYRGASRQEVRVTVS